MSVSFLLIRHAQSVWNAAGRWQGQADPPLSDLGVAQAFQLARALKDTLRADRLICSDLRRARYTAEVLGRAIDLVPEPEPRLRELDVGSWSGLTRAEIQARDPERLARFEAGDPQVLAGGGESRAQIRARVLEVFRDLSERHRGELVAVVAHLGVVRALVPGTELGHTEFLQATPDHFRDAPGTTGGSAGAGVD